MRKCYWSFVHALGLSDMSCAACTSCTELEAILRMLILHGNPLSWLPFRCIIHTMGSFQANKGEQRYLGWKLHPSHGIEQLSATNSMKISCVKYSCNMWRQGPPHMTVPCLDVTPHRTPHGSGYMPPTVNMFRGESPILVTFHLMFTCTDCYAPRHPSRPGANHDGW